MTQLQHVQAFVEATRSVRTLDDLRSLTSDAVVELGFDYFALLHHVDFTHPPPGTFQVGTFPVTWLGIQRERRYLADDPVLAACQYASAGFTWNDLPKLIRLTDKQRKVMTAAQREGLGDGFTVPNHVPGEPLGCATFVVRPGRRFPAKSTSAAQSIGNFAFEAGRRIARSHAGIGLTPRLPPLSSRQLDCVVMIARGKSDSVAAQLLGISARTVNQHVEAAKRRYEVASRQQLIIRALYESQITFSDVLH